MGHGAGEAAGVVADDGERLLELVRDHRGELAHEARTLHRDEPFVVAFGFLLDAPLLLHGPHQLRGAAADQVFGAHAVHDDAEQHGGEKCEPDAVVSDEGLPAELGLAQVGRVAERLKKLVHGVVSCARPPVAAVGVRRHAQQRARDERVEFGRRVRKGGERPAGIEDGEGPAPRLRGTVGRDEPDARKSFGIGRGEPLDVAGGQDARVGASRGDGFKNGAFGIVRLRAQGFGHGALDACVHELSPEHAGGHAVKFRHENGGAVEDGGGGVGSLRGVHGDDDAQDRVGRGGFADRLAHERAGAEEAFENDVAVGRREHEVDSSRLGELLDLAERQVAEYERRVRKRIGEMVHARTDEASLDRTRARGLHGDHDGRHGSRGRMDEDRCGRKKDGGRRPCESGG